MYANLDRSGEKGLLRQALEKRVQQENMQKAHLQASQAYLRLKERTEVTAAVAECTADTREGRPGDVLERPCTAGGGGGGNPPLDPPPPPPPLPIFEAGSQSFALALSVPRGLTLQNSQPAFGVDHMGTLGGGGGGGSQTPPSPPSNTSLGTPPPGLCDIPHVGRAPSTRSSE